MKKRLDHQAGSACHAVFRNSSEAMTDPTVTQADNRDMPLDRPKLEKVT
jgi:hypothetical protein